MTYFEKFRDPELCRGLVDTLARYDTPLTFMEVCGTHTVSIFQSGLRTLLPGAITHLSGPGCPVCVTHDAEVTLMLEVARNKDVIVATFGDLMRVPAPGGDNLKKAKADGARVEIVYSAFDAIGLAKANPDKQVVFLGVGFETTAPTVAATVQAAKRENIDNFTVLAFHKLVPPALRALLAGDTQADDVKIDAFMLPGHVCAIIGVEPFAFLAEEFGVPAAVTGFEPVDILHALVEMQQMRADKAPRVANLYTRVVADTGNPKAVEIMYDVFQVADARWRGIGTIPDSGLVFTPEYEQFDACARLGLELVDVKPLAGCKCGDVLKGRITPAQCPLFGTACTPANPVGPCMVSTEGSCAAYFKYQMD